jgi:hypothetical protein
VSLTVFKTVGRRLSAAMVGSTPTRFRHLSVSYRPTNHRKSARSRECHLHHLGMGLLHLVRDHVPIHVHGGADVAVPHELLLHFPALLIATQTTWTPPVHATAAISMSKSVIAAP